MISKFRIVYSKTCVNEELEIMRNNTNNKKRTCNWSVKKATHECITNTMRERNKNKNLCSWQYKEERKTREHRNAPSDTPHQDLRNNQLDKKYHHQLKHVTTITTTPRTHYTSDWREKKPRDERLLNPFPAYPLSSSPPLPLTSLPFFPQWR